MHLTVKVKTQGRLSVEELEELNSQALSLRIAYLMIGKDRVFLQEVNPTCYDRSQQRFEDEYVELMKKAQAKEDRLLEERNKLKAIRERKELIESVAVVTTELEKIQVEFDTKHLEISGERISLNRISGDFIEKSLAPKYLRLFGFTKIRYHKRPNDPYDYTGIRRRAFWLIDVKSKKGLPTIFRFV